MRLAWLSSFFVRLPYRRYFVQYINQLSLHAEPASSLMDLRHLRTFITVADAGTVSKASVLLHVAQPALSRQIKELEDEFGVRLFQGVRRRLILTTEGERLLADSRTVLGAAHTLTENAKLLRGGDSGTLRVAAPAQMIERAFSAFLHEYARR